MARSLHVALNIRQQPQQALVATVGKEKSRKPIDPPPIVQIDVRPQIDPQRHFLVSPYLFMVATLLPQEDKITERDGSNPPPSANMLGSLCSSLHRLKDSNNFDGGFFIFGDLSVRVTGTHRLRFALYDVSKIGESAAFITDVISEEFAVVAPKDFHGMEESSALSRTFSDQGVRLRLRKEPRSITSSSARRTQRRFSPTESRQSGHSGVYTQRQPQSNEQYSESSRGVKRRRSDTEYAEDGQTYPPSQMARSQYGMVDRIASIYGEYGQTGHASSSLGQSYAHANLGAPDYSVRPTMYGAGSSGTASWQNYVQQPRQLAQPNLLSSVMPAGEALGEAHVPSHPFATSSSFGSASNTYSDHAPHSATYSSYAASQTVHSGQPMSTRTGSVGYAAAYDYRTPTSLTDSSNLASANEAGPLPSSAGTMSTGLGTSEHTPAQSHSYHNYGTLNAGYSSMGAGAGAAAAYSHSSPVYTTSAQPLQSSLDQLNASLTRPDMAGSNYSHHLPPSMPPSDMQPNVPSNMLLGQTLPKSFYQQDESTSYPTPTHGKPPGQWG
nr:hypothetical protein B0A51_13680 [Rachicladosporium sp. CCFEE 5018]